jgi:hypothetical protein
MDFNPVSPLIDTNADLKIRISMIRSSNAKFLASLSATVLTAVSTVSLIE